MATKDDDVKHEISHALALQKLDEECVQYQAQVYYHRRKIPLKDDTERYYYNIADALGKLCVGFGMHGESLGIAPAFLWLTKRRGNNTSLSVIACVHERFWSRSMMLARPSPNCAICLRCRFCNKVRSPWLSLS
jgi:hypothetical protein